jgi:hypothetical protein
MKSGRKKVSNPKEGAQEVIKVRLLRAGKVIRSYKVRSNTFTIGSGEGCTIRAAGDTSLAAKHATVYVEQGELILVPEPNAKVLLNGGEVDFAVPAAEDVIKAGKLTFRVELADRMGSAMPVARATKETVDALQSTPTPEAPERRDRDGSAKPSDRPPPDPALAKTMLGLGAVDIPLPPLKTGPSEEPSPRQAGESSASKSLREVALNPFAQVDDEEPSRLSWRTDSILPGMSALRKPPQINDSSAGQELSEDRETVEKLAVELYSRSEEDSDPYIDENIVRNDVVGSPHDEADYYFATDDDEDEWEFKEPFDLAALLLVPKEMTGEDTAKTPRETYCVAHVVRIVEGRVMEIIGVLPRKPFCSASRELHCRIKGKQLDLKLMAKVTGETCQGGGRLDISSLNEKRGKRRLRLKDGGSALLRGEHETYKIDVYCLPRRP